MDNSKLISAIIPVYKVERYLNQCISSIINQTYQNLEIILVDDGSPDNCPKMCDEWAKKDSRIKVVHKSNGGLSDARNAGLDIAKGEYIAFVDSDDYIAPLMIKTLYTVAEKNQSDIVECNYCLFSENDEVVTINNTHHLVKNLNKSEALEELIKERTLKHVVWNKLYRKNVLLNLRFEVGKLHEDTFFTYKAFNNCSAITKIENQLYFYRQRTDSIMGTKFSLRNLDSLEARQNIYQFTKENYPALSSSAQEKLLLNCLYLGQMALLTKDDQLIEQAFIKINDIYKKNYKYQRPVCAFKYQIWYFVGLISLKWCCNIRNKLEVGF